MRDPRFVILEQVTDILKSLDSKVYSVIPDDTSGMFVYIGDIQLAEIQNKTAFTLEGFVSVELYSGTNEWVGSKAPLYTELDNIKSLLQPVKGFVLDLSPKFAMAYWKIISDVGLIQYSTTAKVFTATIQYGFSIKDLGVPNQSDVVVHYGVPVVDNGEQVIHNP